MRKLVLISVFIISIFFCVSATNREEVIYRSVSNRENKISFSFDDGPHPKLTPLILDILEKHDVKATFFVVGQNAEYYPDVLRQIADQGHEIGNHSFSHKIFPDMSKECIYGEISQNHNTVLSLCEYDIKLFRPPGGVLNEKIKEVAKMMDYRIILWDVDTRDWAHKSVEDITQNIISNTKNGSIILFHDYISSNSPTPDVLEKIIPILKGKGYEIVPVGELID